MAPAMAMSEKSIEEYTLKMRGRYAPMTGCNARAKQEQETKSLRCPNYKATATTNPAPFGVPHL
jgi:hypothetical protein